MKEIFENPGHEYRGKPFWSWNGKLDKDEILRQIDVMKQMGMGGYFCHSRTGLVTEYLGEKWFELINACADYGSNLNLETWIYDEDRWPSGTAGGLVTENPEFRLHYIRLNIIDSKSYKYDSDNIAVFSVNLDGYSYTDKIKLSNDEIPSGNTVLYFTVEEMAKQSFYNGNTYVDTMNLEAIEYFIDITHKKYKEYCNGKLGNTIKGVFTDEPHRGAVMNGFGMINENGTFLTPYPKNLFLQFKKRFKYDLIEFLPELFLFNNGEKISPIKWQYMELLQELFIENFFIPIENWCHDNKMLLTGHVLHEDTLTTQGCMIGSVMRAYEYMDYPGVDILSQTNRNYWVAIQLRSVGRQLDKKWLLSELYGCTGWQMSFEDHKAVGDWQALFGINVRCHHLSWYTMEGEAKRDYPASILHQSAWYKDYNIIEDYFARLHVLLMEGEPFCDTLIINPVESTWCCIHPGWSLSLQTNDKDIKEVEDVFTCLFLKLCACKVEFDLGDEEHIKKYGSVEQSENTAFLKIGKMSYKNIFVPKMLTMRKTTLDLLNEFSQKGGNLIFVEEPVKYIDAVYNDISLSLNASYIKLQEANFYTNFSFIKTDKETDDIFSSIRKVDDGYIVVMMNMNTEKAYRDVLLTFEASGYIEKWDLKTGKVGLLGKGNKLIYSFPPSGELAIKITNKNYGYKEKIKTNKSTLKLLDEYNYSLSEPNVCVIDFVEYKLNDEWMPCCDVLLADMKIREDLSMPLRGGEMLQPWFTSKIEDNNRHSLSLRCKFNINKIPKTIKLAVETPEHFDVLINGKKATTKTDDFWVDICFKVFEVNKEELKIGENIIELSCSFENKINLEAIYLLGDFGVYLNGPISTLNELPEKIKIGDVTAQGLPFYGAAINYNVGKVESDINTVEISSFSGAFIKVIDSKGKFIYIYSKPYEVDISELNLDDITLQCMLTRRNTFGPLHFKPIHAQSYSPDLFTIDIDGYTLRDSYGLISSGILQ